MPRLCYFCTNDEQSRLFQSTKRPKMCYEGGEWKSISSLSRVVAKTLEQAKTHWGIPEEPCRECKRIFVTDWIEPIKTILRQKNICISCYNWLDNIERDKRVMFAVIDGHHYVVEPEHASFRMRGHSGRHFTVRFTAGKNKGRTVETTNLWHQGKIPPHFLSRLPNNAEFVTK